MNNFIKTFKLLLHNFIYFLILAIGYNGFCVGAFQYNLFGFSQHLLSFITVTIFLLFLTYYFFIKTLKNKKNSIILLVFLILSIFFCITPTAISRELIPNIFHLKIHFFFYDFFPTWVFIHQGLYLISYIYQRNLDKNKIVDNRKDPVK